MGNCNLGAPCGESGRRRPLSGRSPQCFTTSHCRGAPDLNGCSQKACWRTSYRLFNSLSTRTGLVAPPQEPRAPPASSRSAHDIVPLAPNLQPSCTVEKLVGHERLPVQQVGCELMRTATVTSSPETPRRSAATEVPFPPDQESLSNRWGDSGTHFPNSPKKAARLCISSPGPHASVASCQGFGGAQLRATGMLGPHGTTCQITVLPSMPPACGLTTTGSSALNTGCTSMSGSAKDLTGKLYAIHPKGPAFKAFGGEAAVSVGSQSCRGARWMWRSATVIG